LYRLIFAKKTTIFFFLLHSDKMLLYKSKLYYWISNSKSILSVTEKSGKVPKKNFLEIS
jgi:hypothetical protein